MRSFLSISLLFLLLYHLCRVWVVLCYFEAFYPTASPVMQGDEWIVVKVPISLPYTTTQWEEPQGKKGLVRLNGQFYNIIHQRYENDTLYTELKTNITAREHFFALAQEVQQIQDQKMTPTSSKTNPSLCMLQF